MPAINQFRPIAGPLSFRPATNPVGADMGSAMTGALMRLLMIVGVLLCSMHIAEPASAHSTSSETAFHLSAGDDEQDGQNPASKLAHGGQHHCPVAPDPGGSLTSTEPHLARAPLFAAPATQLASRILPPLLDPPLLAI